MAWQPIRPPTPLLFLVVVAPLVIVDQGIKPSFYGEVEQARTVLFQGGAVRTVPIVEESDIGLERIGP